MYRIVHMDLYTALSRIRLLVILKKSIDQVEFSFFRLRQNVMLKARNNGLVQIKKTHSYTFAIVCVKRPEYVAMAIENINSLHFYNSTHAFVLYLDSVCLEEVRRYQSRILYPERVELLNFFGKTKQPWMISKIEALIDASKKNRILTDADGIWRSDLVIDLNKISFLVRAYTFQSNRIESLLIKKILKKPEWCSFTHYVSGFVSIPSKFMSKKLAEDIQRITKKIYTAKIATVSQDERESIRRLSEEIGVSLAVQIRVPASKITTIKTSDGPGNRKILQSMYYGCANKISQ